MIRTVTTIAFGLCLSAGTLAQDSVSKTSGLPGDALDPYTISEQVNTYVVDLSPLTTSWGTQFNLGPIAKTSAGDPAFFNNLAGSSATSAMLLRGRPFPYASYDLWSNPGFGINDDPSKNDAGSPITPTGLSNQFTAVFSEFGGGTYRGIISTVVNYKPGNARRLYVGRVQTAINGENNTEDRATMYVGGVDADSNVSFRTDDFGLIGPCDITGNNIFRVRALDRDPASRNMIDKNGANDVGDWLIRRSGTTHNTPFCIPTQLIGRPVTMTTNFDAEYVFERSIGSMKSTQAHLGGRSDHRGGGQFFIAKAFRTAPPPTGTPNPSTTNPRALFATGTAAMYGKDLSDDTRSVLMWGLNGQGDVTSTLQLDLPSTITDNDDGFTFPSTGTISGFLHYLSQVAFNGGNNGVSVGQDQKGRILVATPVAASTSGGSDNPINAMAVARFNPNNPAGTLEWSLAGWNSFPGGDPSVTPVSGKEILDGPNGNVIGQIVGLNNVTCGTQPCGDGSPRGPSMSAPCIDAAGNVWFIAAVEFFGADRNDPTQSDFDNALLRAVYNPTTFSYQLERVLELGQVFPGQNSGRNYQISFLTIADSNSVSSGTLWSGNIIQTAQNGRSIAGLPTSDPRTLGGLTFSCAITYDVNDDGDFDTATGDERYQAMMFLGADS